ncbi:helix-turn-helix domain-containing protein [Zoogloea sp.]|uniref:helix-turn-helix domain-containing protein n=1 Tax=Zoogloea sp. TaxID=49181 RepID=UPI001ACBC53E|nr:helix-turn-helix domain-containing protein [Zoogloea sp.]MBN8285470.1 helix-turn-helix domain-containing protein [Zoogloea sp.]
MLKTNSPMIIMTEEELRQIISMAAAQAAEEVIKRLPSSCSTPRPPHVTQVQACEMLGMSHPTVRKMIRTGKIKLNDAGLIPIVEIDRVLQPRNA